MNWLPSNGDAIHFCLLIGANVVSNGSFKAFVRYALVLFFFSSFLPERKNEKTEQKINNTSNLWVNVF